MLARRNRRHARELAALADPGAGTDGYASALTAAVHADRQAAERLPATRTKALEVLRTFSQSLSKQWIADAEQSNQEFYDAFAPVPDPGATKVMVGTLHGYENEFERCKASVARQSHPNLEHVVLSGLSKKDSVSTLMERFLDSDADILVKVDADMVLLETDLVSRVVEVFAMAPDLQLLQMAVMDFFSGQAMQGINAYRRSIDWRTERQDRLFTDKTFVDKSQRLVAWAPFLQSAIHSPDPSTLQAFHFGVHRGLKVLQPLSEEFNTDRAEEQALYLERCWDHFKLRRDKRLVLACLGFELALGGRFELEDLDHSSPTIPEALAEFEPKPVEDLERLVEELRGARIDSTEVQRVRDQRRFIAATASADIRSILIPLPHFGVFGGVNRFFQLAEQFEDLGVECVLTEPDRAWGMHNGRMPEWREEYPWVRTVEYSEALARSWDVVLCGDCTSGVMLTLPWFTTRLSAAYLLNGWAHRQANETQIRLSGADVVIANSSWAARWYRDLAPVVVPGGVDLTVFTPPDDLDTRPAWGERLRVTAYGGRRKKRKRFEDALAACSLASAQGVPLELHVYDERPIEGESDFPLVYHGKLDRSGVAGLMRETDVMLCAEQDAGWSNPGAEAMACGATVVCTAAGTTDFAVDGRSALTVPVGSPEAMAQAIERLWKDPALARSLRSEGLTRIAELGWPSVARGLLDVFRSVARDHPRREAADSAARKRVDRVVAGAAR